MPRDDAQNEEFGQDSFLDVVANIVGVLVILVMLIGMRVTQNISHVQASAKVSGEDQQLEIPSESAIDSPNELVAQVEEATRHAVFLESGLRNTNSRILGLHQQASFQEQHRMELALLRAEMEEKLQQRRDALSAESQEKFDVQNKIFEAKLKLDKLSSQQLHLLSSPGEVEEIEVVPTPIARRVDEKATHLRVLGGLVCRVPFYELRDQLQYETASIQRELANNGQVNRVIGPTDGFRLRVRAEKIQSGQAVTGPRVGSLSNRDKYLQIFYYLAESDELGERVEQALLPDSNFREILRAARKQSSVLVVWVYSDSFDEYRSLKKLLSEMDFSIAVYNRPMGTQITASVLGRDPKAQ